MGRNLRRMNLIEWRKSQGLKQFEAAERLGVSPAQLSRIERGAQWPEPATILKIETGTGGEVTANDILEHHRRQPEKAA
jgi:transcriptional regulator with XRE-family HTH domain